MLSFRSLHYNVSIQYSGCGPAEKNAWGPSQRKAGVETDTSLRQRSGYFGRSQRGDVENRQLQSGLGDEERYLR